MPNIQLKIPITPPGTLGTFLGVHIYVEMPDQSSLPTARMDGVTDMSGSFVMQDDWAPIDCGKFPYVAAEQPFTLNLPSGLNPKISHDLRVYAASYSSELDNPLVRYGSVGASPSVVVTVPAQTVNKPGSGSNVTPFLVTGISESVSAPVLVSGKLRRPISITVSLAGLPTLPTNWAYQLLGFQDNDLTTDPVLATGIITDTTGGLIPAGPDGINTPHTFGPEEPTVPTSITIYAVAGLIASDRFVPGLPPHTPGAFMPNNIVPGITASCVVSIGTTTGVSDPTAAIQALLDSSVGVNSLLFGVNPLGIDTARIALSAVNTAQLANLAATAAKLAAGSVTAANGALAGLAVVASNMATNSITAANGAIAALAVGTAAIQTAAITTALMANASVTNAIIANLAVGTAQIANLAVTNAKINDLDVSKLNAGTITVAISLTAPTITVTSGTTTINIDGTNLIKLHNSGSSSTVQVTGDQVIVTNPSFSASSIMTPLQVIVENTSTLFAASIQDDGLYVNNGSGTLRVVGPRLPGPGNPVFSVLSDAQSWCQSVLNQLRNHGLLT